MQVVTIYMHIKNNYAAQSCRLYVITCGIQNILTECY